jgi:replicative DNA helicase
MKDNETKVLPSHPELEQVIIGASLVSPEGLASAVAAGLHPDDFSVPSNRKIAATMLDMFLAGRPVDILTVEIALRQKGEIDAVGGPAGLAAMIGGIPSYSHLDEYVALLKKNRLRRDLIKHSNQLLTQAWDDDGTDVCSQVERAIDGLASLSSGGQQKLQSFSDLASSLLDDLEQRESTPGDCPGLRTGFHELDAMTGGFLPGQVVILAARPKQGKSALAGIMASQICRLNKATGLFFPLEMGTLEIGHRMVVARAKVDGMRYKTGQLQQQEWAQVRQAIHDLDGLPLHFGYSPNLTLGGLRAQVRLQKLLNGGKLDFVIIDYFQLMTPDPRPGDTRNTELTRISKGIKQLAMEENLTIILLSQMSRLIEQRRDRKPILSDLRETGSLEQDADIVLFLYEELDNPPFLRTLSIAAQRNGPTGDIHLGWIPRFMLFVNPDVQEAA